MNKSVCMLFLGGIFLLWSCKGTKTTTQKTIKKELINSITHTPSITKKFVPNNSKLMYENPKVIEKIQIILYLNNYQTGRVNGEMTAETLRALASFQQANNIEVGDRSTETLSALGVNVMDFGVIDLQENLERKGHDPGVIDGILGPRTRTAYQTFLRKNGLNSSGFSPQIKEKLLEENKQITAPKTIVPNSISKSAHSSSSNLSKSEQVRSVQEALKRKGYDPGNVDGVFSLPTKDALFKYQVDLQLPIGGFNADTMKSLGL